MLKSSCDRPAWTSEDRTGMFNSWKHKHVRPRNQDGDDPDPIFYHFYSRNLGFSNRQYAVDLMEGPENDKT
jgi:hypothetical protein